MVDSVGVAAEGRLILKADQLDGFVRFGRLTEQGKLGSRWWVGGCHGRRGDCLVAFGSATFTGQLEDDDEEQEYDSNE